MDYLANQFGVRRNNSTDIQEYTTNIIEKICNSLYCGQILFIYVELYSPDVEDTFLVWFIKQLWNPLISRLLEQLSNQDPSIRVLAVIAVDGQVPEDCLPQDLYCGCRPEDFDSTKILEIPLETWTEEEIRNWLFNFSGLTDPKIGLSISEINRMAKSIFAASYGGLPARVYDELKKQLKDVINYKFEQYSISQ
ncbi:MAG: hypothetical protein F6K47_29895 [Symploca sp. SIO2E6]|nr:hypothetical protein [Symploca sp. SIO2E6]